MKMSKTVGKQTGNVIRKNILYTGTFKDQTKLNHIIKGQAYLLVSKGDIKIDDIKASKGDGIAIKDENEITLECHANTEIILIEVPGEVEAR